MIPPPEAWRRGGGAVPALRQTLPLRPLAAVLEEACRHPAGAVALAGNAGHLDRPALLARLRQVAATVRRRVPSGGVVAACVPQTPAGVAALLGCAMAGRVTVVLNAADPAERQALTLADATPAAILFDETQAAALPWPAGARAIPFADCDASDGDLSPIAHDPDAPCMVHYTSGSTGRPKGIVLSAFAILTRAAMGVERQVLTPADRLLVPTTISDASAVASTIASLVGGGTKLVVSLPGEGIGGLVRLAARERVTVLSSTAAVLRAVRGLAGTGPAIAAVRYLRVGGTGLPADELAAWRAMLPPGAVISHAYASSESQLVTEWAIPPARDAEGANAAVGPVLSGVEFALVDDNGRPAPDGVPGHLVLRGRHMALGGWQDGRVVPGPMLPDPSHPTARIFPTGDLLARDADGVLRFHGRADRQIKVNGVRVEPAEVEAVLRAEPGIAEAAVIQTADGTLHAFLATATADWPSLQTRLRHRLRAALPPALRPRRLHPLPTMPLLPSAKPDLTALRRLAEAQA